MSGASKGPVVATLTQAGMHALTFRVGDLQRGKVACTICGQQLTREEWAENRPCPGRRDEAERC